MIGGTSVWERRETEGTIVSDQIYHATIGGVLLWGFALNYLMVTLIPVQMILSIPFWILLIGYFISVIAGTMIYQKSDNPAISFLGYNLIVVPVGIVITPFIHSFDPNLISEAMMVTGGVTGLMMFLGMLYPAFFLSMGRVLTLALISVIVVEIGMSFFMGTNPEILDWIVALIFCGYIGFDWARANKIPKTLDNAVDSAASLYLDIINLFIRILSIMGRR
jgi:FtsH-binding integral membrane protein